ncbi:DUF6896 domain-containing protein [Nannocystis pusilla]|uniref:DUF6896 domain-containing protein n=1 Tax=Nannocystis pusilla TaxID=889268 RepID=UPI003DA4DC1C
MKEEARPGDQGPILRELRRFVDAQVGLLAAFHRAYASDDGTVRLREIPRVGEVEFEARSWRCARHGGGVAFFEPVTGRAIDVHDKLDRPHVFDAWRLQLYFGSLGRAGAKMLERACARPGLPVSDAVELLVAHWLDTGAVVGVPGALMLA